jgi:hypothetical protein
MKTKQIKKDNEDDEQKEENFFASHGRQEPQLKIAFPGAE